MFAFFLLCGFHFSLIQKTNREDLVEKSKHGLELNDFNTCFNRVCADMEGKEGINCCNGTGSLSSQFYCLNVYVIKLWILVEKEQMVSL